MDIVQQNYIKWLDEGGLHVTSEQLAQFKVYFEELVHWNEKINLTAIVDEEQVYLKHFYDSITLSFFVSMPACQTLADIGSGAGFPSLPLKILFPHLHVTIVDSLNKRIQFLQQLVDKLGLTDVQCVHGRAEDVGRMPQYRDRFDLVTARAVARLNVLNEFCLPFVRVGGQFAAMKGAKAEEELHEATTSIRVLQAKLNASHEIQLPHQEGERQIILLSKVGKTPHKYPRKAGTPIKQPIV